MDHNLRRTRLAERLDAFEIDAMLSTHLPNVRYLSGYSGSNGQMLVGANGCRFFTDGRYIEQSRREVPDVERVIYSTDWIEQLTTACRELGAKRLGFEAPYVTYRSHEELAKAADTLVPLDDEVGKLRWAKDPEELALIERAQELTDAGFETILTKFEEGITERELALELDWAMLRGGAEAVAFETIAAFGEQAAEPHHSPTDRSLRRGDVVKLDFGAVHEGYHSDMTRTVAFGEPPEELRKVYQVVLEAQLAGIEAVRAGVSGGEADKAARSLIEAAGYGEAFTHSLGHGVGLEIHEGPTLRAGSDEVLPEGTVVTVEPGVYLAGVGGVRIEDMVVVTATGCRPMPSSSKELIIL